MSKKRNLLLPLILISFGAYAIATFIGNAFFMDLLSPVTVGLVLLLLLLAIKDMGNFECSTLAMSAGVFLWFIADILFFCNDFIISKPGSLSALCSEIYLYPNAFYALCISIVMIDLLKKKKIEIALLMSNTLCFAIVGFVLILNFHIYAAGGVYDPSHNKEVFFFFLSFYSIMMCIQVFTHTGLKNSFKASNIATVGILGYAIIDLFYDFQIALDTDAENKFLNLFYVMFMVFMAIGIAAQQRRQYVYDFIPRDFSKRATKRRFAHLCILIAVDLVLICYELIPREPGMYILIALLSYLITNYIMHSEHMDQIMLKNQQQQNAILEQRVQEKTLELETVNKDLQILSSTDMLTGLRNRRSSIEYLQQAVEYSKRNLKSFAVLCIDLNHFKPVNDTYGHEIGDMVLAELGKRMNALPSRYVAFRMGGDEFMICLMDVIDRADVEAAAEDIRTLFNTPIISDNYIFNLSASTGIAIYPDDSSNYELLLSYADAAMYDIKKSSNKDGYKFFDSNMTHIIERKDAISRAVAKAVPERDFTLYYQPQVDSVTGNIIGVEVYPHLKGDMEDVSPGELIPVVEESGLLSRLSIWMIKHALETITEWNKKYGLELEFSVNLSPLQLTDAELIESLERLCSEYGVNTKKITLDISNEVIIGASYSAKDVMEALHNFGFSLSLNDFGGKNINLKYLMDCGIDCIELSRTLIAGVENDPCTKVLIDSIIKFATSMGITVAAVGIENMNQLKLLRSMGIPQMQGYLLCKPIPHYDFEKILSTPDRKIVID